MAKRATRAQKLKRIRAVYQMLLCDTCRPDILSYCNKEWEIKTKMADNYIAAANELIVEEAARLRENILDKHLMQRAMLRHEAIKEGDKRLALDLLRDEAQLIGLYAPKAKVVTQKNIEINWDDLSNDEIKALAEGQNPAEILSNPGPD
jgi:hypothetical protein